jgi:uncharacterized protein YkwD
MNLFNLLLLLGIPSTDSNPTISDRSLVALTSPDFEDRIFASVNDHRRSLRLRELLRMPQLDRIASGHTQTMLEANVLSHDNWKGKRDRQILGLGFSGGAENVAGGECYPSEIQKTIEFVVLGWIESLGHRQNIETAKFTHTGMALLIRQHPQMSDRVVFFATQIFAAV